MLEIWNQFVFSGAKKKLIISIINSIADGLRKKGLDTVLAVPPLRGYNRIHKSTLSLYDNVGHNNHFILFILQNGQGTFYKKEF